MHPERASAGEPAPGAAGAAVSASFPGFRSIGARYQLINELGHGGMGSVYRALDRLTGRVVTLKRLRLPGVPGAPPDGSRHERFLLAQEFRLLSSLRHPNIVSVLDYGFDEDREPYLTMDLEENARTITEAGAAQAIALRVDLLVQMLRALAYLHRHGIIHRDLKPENVVVVGDQVKVLDFGLSLSRDAAERERGGFAGTLQYLAPEMLQGAPPSEQCDLYAVGVIAYELLVGSYPYPQNSALTLSLEIAGTPLPRPSDPVDSRFRPILERLLAKHPEDRCRDAAEVIAALAVALDQPLAVETVVTRESFLQSAPLVGREEELATLTGILRAAARGRGGAWLVCGESGVGKSRLLDELRTQALVDGFVVARGQAVGQGGGPYHVWRDAISRLVLRPDLPDAEAAVLKAVLPDISFLLRREIGDAPGIDLEATQSRLFVSVDPMRPRR